MGCRFRVGRAMRRNKMAGFCETVNEDQNTIRAIRKWEIGDEIKANGTERV
jgi:hypothetical protein